MVDIFGVLLPSFASWKVKLEEDFGCMPPYPVLLHHLVSTKARFKGVAMNAFLALPP